MKKKKIARNTYLLTIAALLFSFYMADSARAKRIYCRFAVMFEVYGSVSECRFGCGKKKPEPPPPKKTPQRPVRGRAAADQEKISARQEPANAESGKGNTSGRGAKNENCS